MVNSNDGLNALAALASAVPASGDRGNDGPSDLATGHMHHPSVNTSVTQAPSSGSTQPASQLGHQLQSAFQAAAANPQWQQILALATGGNNCVGTSSALNAATTVALTHGAPYGTNNNANSNNSDQLNALANLQRQLQQADPSAQMAMQQQLNYLNLFQLSQAKQQQPPPPPPQPPQQQSNINTQLQALQLALAGRNIPGLSNLLGGCVAATGDYKSSQLPPTSPPFVLPTAPASSNNNSASSSMSTNSANNMPPPPPASLVNIKPQQKQMPMSQAAIAPQPDDHDREFGGPFGNRKLQKRAANRKSAQLSRKRKKQFIEELKDENDGLRRKELILKSIPDLIVVFDSSGKLWFVSESVARFVDFSADELLGTSFWDRLCDDSVRLLKAAFMDSLAARQPESDTADLGAGFWELRLVDKDGAHKVVTLNGVVHFAGDRPECVCSIRPQEMRSKTTVGNNGSSNKVARKEQVSDTQGSDSNSSASQKHALHYTAHHKSLIRVKPQQSVVTTDRSSSDSSFTGKRRAGSIRISDSGNSSGISDSGSSDEQNNDTGN